MGDIDAHLTAARAILDARNFRAADRHLKDAARIDPDDLALFDLQIDLYLTEDKVERALAHAKERASRAPDCRTARLNILLIHGELKQTRALQEAAKAAETDFATDPVMLDDIRLLRDVYSGKLSAARRRLERLRAGGYGGQLDLRRLERTLNHERGDLGRVAKDNASRLSRGHVDGFTLIDQAMLALRAGRLFAARSLARQASVMDARYSLLASETRALSALFMTPLFWTGYVCLTVITRLGSKGYLGRVIGWQIGLALHAVLLIYARRAGPSDLAWGGLVVMAILNLALALYSYAGMGRWAHARAKRLGKPTALREDY